MKNFVLAGVLILVGSAFGLSQAKAVKPRFTSIYTNFTTSCKDFDGEGGTDGYSLCRGPGGYRVRVYYSAAAVHFNAELVKDESSNIPIAMAPIAFSPDRTRLEWRLANGKPFAVIMRVPTYAEPRNDNEYFGPKNGERLNIRGLTGIELDTFIDAKPADANKRARDLADEAYLKTVTRN